MQIRIYDRATGRELSEIDRVLVAIDHAAWLAVVLEDSAHHRRAITRDIGEYTFEIRPAVDEAGCFDIGGGTDG